MLPNANSVGIVLRGIDSAYGVWLLAVMLEASRVSVPPEGRFWRAVGRTAVSGLRLVRSRPTLMTLLAISAFTSMWSEGMDRLWQAHVIEPGIPQLGQFEPVVWFGVIGNTASLAGYLAYELAERRLKLIGPLAAARALIVLAVITRAAQAHSHLWNRSP